MNKQYSTEMSVLQRSVSYIEDLIENEFWIEKARLLQERRWQKLNQLNHRNG